MMTTNGQKSLSAIGFLTTIHHAEHGIFGGYLVLNSVGRPLEFHCTAPVRPNRAQEILYGPALEPYIYGERIGPALLEKSKSQPVSVLTDIHAAMAARPHVATPMTLVVLDSPQDAEATSSVSTRSSRQWRLDRGHDSRPATHSHLSHFDLGAYRLAVDEHYPDDEATFLESWPEFAGHINLDEPFDRIREAIDEARRGASA